LILLVLAGATTFVTGAPTLLTVAQTICVLLMLPYFISGLSMVHDAVRKTEMPLVWLMLFYFFLLPFGGWLLLTLYALVKHIVELSWKIAR
jgi:hypothetical protein